MSIDPSIPLQIQSGQSNPLGQLGSLLDIQSRLNANRQFQAEYGARQQVGQIVSQAPDLETGLSQAAQDPRVAAFGGKALGELRAMQQTMVGTQGLQQTQNRDALQATVKAASAAALTDPSNMAATIQAQMASLPKEVRERSAPAISAYIQSLTDGNPNPGQFRSRAVGSLIGAGLSPEAVAGLTGKADILNLGNRQVPGVQMPAFAGGGFAPSGQVATQGIAPSWQTAGGATIATGGLGPAGLGISGGGAGGPQPMGSAAGAWGGAGGPGGGGSPVPRTGAPSARAPAPATDFGPNPLMGGITFDHNGVITSGPPAGPQGGLGPMDISPTARAPLGLAGIPAISPGDQDRIKGQLAQYTEGGTRAYQAAQGVIGGLNILDSSLDHLASNGGFTVPGTAGAVRANLGKFVNTVQGVLGAKPSFDPASIASAEDLQKQTNTLAFQLANQYEGNQRVAAETITKALNAVPGIDNSYLGAKLLADGIRASAQRQMDFHEFQTQWLSDPRRAGKGADLGNSDVAFNKANPPEKYTNAIMAKYGLTNQGFTSPEAVGKLVQQHLLEPEQAATILRSQFSDKFK